MPHSCKKKKKIRNTVFHHQKYNKCTQNKNSSMFLTCRHLCIFIFLSSLGSQWSQKFQAVSIRSSVKYQFSECTDNQNAAFHIVSSLCAEILAGRKQLLQCNTDRKGTVQHTISKVLTGHNYIKSALSI